MSLAKTRYSDRGAVISALSDDLVGIIEIESPHLCEENEDDFDAMISTVAVYKLLTSELSSDAKHEPNSTEGGILGTSAIDLTKKATTLEIPRILYPEQKIQINEKKILYIDMDNVLVDFKSGIDQLEPKLITQYENDLDDVPGIFALMDPMPGAIEAFNILVSRYDTYILSTAPWNNPTAWSDKLLWVRSHLGSAVEKRLILTHHKNLNRGDYLIDDRLKRGADKFVGEHIHFGQKNFPDWDAVLRYLVKES
jgi:5'(3')-deoxyribonucleotidase